LAGNVIAVNVHELKRIDHEGEAAGKAGHHRDANPYTPGTEYAQRWDSAWLRGQAELAETLGPETPKRRGRPPGSKNKPKTGVEAAEQQLDDEEGDDADFADGEEPLPFERAPH
jgi:ribosome modulation factor